MGTITTVFTQYLLSKMLLCASVSDVSSSSVDVCWCSPLKSLCMCFSDPVWAAVRACVRCGPECVNAKPEGVQSKEWNHWGGGVWEQRELRPGRGRGFLVSVYCCCNHRPVQKSPVTLKGSSSCNLREFFLVTVLFSRDLIYTLISVIVIILVTFLLIFFSSV